MLLISNVNSTLRIVGHHANRVNNTAKYNKQAGELYPGKRTINLSIDIVCNEEIVTA